MGLSDIVACASVCLNLTSIRHATIDTVKIRKKGTKSVAPHKTQSATRILPNSGRYLNRPKIDGLCARIAALPIMDDALTPDHADAEPHGGNSRF